MVWLNKCRVSRLCLAIRTERISELVIGLLELPFTLLRAGRGLEFAVRFEKHSLALGLELVPGSLEGIETIERRPQLPLHLHERQKRIGQSLESL